MTKSGRKGLVWSESGVYFCKNTSHVSENRVLLCLFLLKTLLSGRDALTSLSVSLPSWTSRSLLGMFRSVVCCRWASLVLWLILLCGAVFLFSRSSYPHHHLIRRLNVSRKNALTLCPEVPPGLVGPIQPDFNISELKELDIHPQLKIGGHWKPETCEAMQRVAIIVPYRNREEHRRILLKNLHPLLQKQQLDYTIFVVDQFENQTFNRAKLMNVGFVEAKKQYDWDCFIFHDPKHMAVAVDKFNYKLYYWYIFGGAIALTGEQMEKMNGFSNDYWGWGGEDDDMYERAIATGHEIHRDNTIIARYKMIQHQPDKGNPPNECRRNLLYAATNRWRKDGLNNLNYSLHSMIKKPLFTYMKADLFEKESKERLKKENSSYVVRV
ncbi:hypothetical protein L596_024789 [Steinernema carpocapsae]|uniref:Beta-1,4-N-acetylgalactosaminyltransferase n=1 Tax=Steinernema carpocapsae TaxID=34508 RepID=A0A4U5M5T6_STECR|nr:hypothetical protein L596_024789 [Steinernema carpocapsae]